MKKIFLYSLTIYVLLFTCHTYAQNADELLAQMPTEDLQHRNRLMEEMLAMGKEGFVAISSQLTPAGAGDDTAVRYTLNSLARFVSQFGMEAQRAQTEAHFIKALEQAGDAEVKTFLMDQLKLIGSDQAVATVCQYLQDEQLCGPAAQTLAAISSQAATEALFKALPSATGATQITIVKALGDLESKEAAPAIAQLLPAGDAALQKAALMALASTGAPDAYPSLWNAARQANFTYEPTNAVDAFLTYTDRLGAQGNLKLCKKAALALAKATRADHQLHTQASALALYTKYFDYEALDALLQAVDHADHKFRTAVLHTAQPVGGVAATRRWIEKAKTAEPAVKADIIAMLGRRKDDLAVSFLKEQMNNPSAAVREEALTALVAIEQTAAVPVLIAHLREGKEVTHTKNTLLYLLDERHLDPLVAVMQQTKGEALGAMIELVAAKSGKRFFDTIMQHTGSEDTHTRVAAFAALKRVATSKDAPQLLELLMKAGNPQQIKAVQEAVVATLSKEKEEDKRAGVVLALLEKAPQKERLIQILPQLGGKDALETVYGFYMNGNGTLQKEAFQALVQWKDELAADKLYLISESTSGKERSEALAGYVRQVTTAAIPDDQKLLKFRKIMPLTQRSEEKQQILSELSKVKTFLSFLYVSEFLNEPAVAQTAARAAMRIALPASDSKVGLYGNTVRTVLQQVEQMLSGAESDYLKEDIRHYLNDMPADKGFVSMFNGKDLSGWHGFVADPVTKAKLSAKVLARRQQEADQKMHENWKVQDGMIVFNGKGENLCSEKEYGDFEMLADWRITKFGDSGIYLRGTPQVQIWDTARVDVGAQVGSGGLYNNEKHPSKPLKVADNAIGEWNTFRIIMMGNQVTVYLNGELVTDQAVLENFWDRSQPIFAKGPVELQAHGTDLAFRNIYIREISAEEYQVKPEEKADGFVSLFNGSNLDGWVGNKTDYLVEDGVLVIRPERGGSGNLYTEKEYSDFNFRFEFQLTPGANNGLGIRTPLEGDAAYVGMEIQILDNTAPVYADLHEYQYHGSVYGVIPAKKGYLKPVGEWNEQEVIVKGTRIQVILNGHTILDGDIAEASKNGTLDGKDHPGLKRKSGHIGFLGHGSVVKFRKIRIKDLSK